MKRYLVTALLLLPVCAQPKPAPAKTSPVKVDKKQATVPPTQSTGLPAEAVEVSPGVYKLADKTGKVWFYRRTPFGVSRYEQPKEQAVDIQAKYAAEVPATQITDQGDSVKFVRPGPFGNYTWVKKKADLDESEKADYEAWQKKTAASEKTAHKATEANPQQKEQ